MLFDGDAMRMSAGPSLKETSEEIKSRAEKLLGAYEKNVAPLLEKHGLQRGTPDPDGHMHYAQQMVRVLKTVLNPNIDPHHWPENFDRSHLSEIPMVFLNEAGEPIVREISARNFDNPKRFIDSVEEILTVAQIKGL